jgi:hypothetical protein
MKNDFIPLEYIQKLKDLGFNKTCFGYYDKERQNHLVASFPSVGKFAAPTWCQAFDFLRKKYNLHYQIVFDAKNNNYSIIINQEKKSKETYNTYEEARLMCLKELIKNM